PGGRLRGHSGDGRLLVPGRVGIRDDQPHRRPALLRGRPAPAHRPAGNRRTLMANRAGSLLYGAWDSDLAYSFRHSPYAIAAAAVFLICVAAAAFAPWIAPHNPFDLSQIDLMNAFKP